MYNVLPLFKSHYSQGRSILTLEKAGSSPENGPDSIVDLALKYDFKKVFLVEDYMNGFLEGYSNLKSAGIDLIFGLRLSVCPDLTDKTEESLSKTSKIVVFSKNLNGYKTLIKINDIAAKDGFYYHPRIDFKTLKSLWNNDNLKLAIPFYDSFIFYNSLSFSICVPEFDFTSPVFFLEKSGLPFDGILESKVKQFADSKFEIIKTKSIYYNKFKDFKAYLTFRCINNRSTLEKPDLDHMSSDEFCLESWKEQNGAN